MNLTRDISGDFAVSEKTYLNNASVSIMPLQSIEAMRNFMKEYCAAGPDSKDSEGIVSEALAGARRAVAEIISCRPEELVLTQSTTDGVNLVATGLGLGGDSNIVIRGMEHEHHSNLYPWLKLGERVSVRSLAIDDHGFFDPGELGSSVDDNTGLVALSHALYNTGAILPMEKVREIVGDGAAFFVDSAQTVGCLGVDVSQMRCDFMSFNGSKWLCGPMGMGLFYCSSGSAGLLEPMEVGGESARLEGAKLEFKKIPDKFQTGFRNYAGAAGLESSARYLLGFGIGNIRQKNARLAAVLWDELERIPGVELYGPEDPRLRTSIVSFNVGGRDPREVVDRLERQGIVMAVREIPGRSIVRASPHFFNTEGQMQAAADAIKSL